MRHTFASSSLTDSKKDYFKNEVCYYSKFPSAALLFIDFDKKLPKFCKKKKKNTERYIYKSKRLYLSVEIDNAPRNNFCVC